MHNLIKSLWDVRVSAACKPLQPDVHVIITINLGLTESVLYWIPAKKGLDYRNLPAPIGEMLGSVQ